MRPLQSLVIGFSLLVLAACGSIEVDQSDGAARLFRSQAKVVTKRVSLDDAKTRRTQLVSHSSGKITVEFNNCETSVALEEWSSYRTRAGPNFDQNVIRLRIDSRDDAADYVRIVKKVLTEPLSRPVVH